MPSITGNTRNLLQYTRIHTRILLPSFFRLFFSHLTANKHTHAITQGSSSARPYQHSILVHIHTLTQPLLPDRADSAYFHRASIAVRLSRLSQLHFPLFSRHMLALAQISTQAASREHMAWTALLSSSPSSSSKHLVSLTSTLANDPLIICAAHRRLLE